MAKGWVDPTKEWERVDETLMWLVGQVLQGHVGREKAIPRSRLVNEVNMRVAVLGREEVYSERQVRAAINALRKRGWLICSTGGVGGGYWMAKNRDEVLEFLEREVRPRYRDLQEIERAMRRAMLEKFGQPTLFEAVTNGR